MLIDASCKQEPASHKSLEYNLVGVGRYIVFGQADATNQNLGVPQNIERV